MRVRVGSILLQLWRHPLGEPRQVILDLVRTSTATATATAAATVFSPPPASEATGVSMSGGGSGGGGTSGGAGATVGETLPVNPLATEFFKATFDTITYFVNDSLDRLRDGVIEERGNGGKAIEAGHPHWIKYMSDRKSVVSGLKNT